jgi:hypothetical protein
VRQGGDGERAVVRPDPERGDGLQHVGDARAVGEHHALGQAGGAAGVGQQREVDRRVDRDLRGRVGAGEQVGEPERVGGLPVEQHEPGADARLLGGGPCGRREGAGGDEEPGGGVVDLRGDLVGGPERVEAADHAARRDRAVAGDEPLGRVGREDRHDVALAESFRREARRGSLDLVGEVAVGQRSAGRGVHHGGVVGPARGRGRGGTR